MSCYQTDLLACLQDGIEFIIEQIEQAKSSLADRLTAVDAAQSVLPFLRSRLKNEESFLAAKFHLAFEFEIHPNLWMEMAKQPQDVFENFADELIGQLRALKKQLESPPP
jgi:uncharacterized protein (DUF2267 family)